MAGEIFGLLVVLPVAAGLVFLVPRTTGRTWALWLLVGGMALHVQQIGVEIYSYYHPDHPDPLYLSVRANEVELHRDLTGEATLLVVNNPPENFRRHDIEHPGGSLVSAFAIWLLLVRAVPAPPAQQAGVSRLGVVAGISIQVLGLAILGASMAMAIIHGRDALNPLGLLVFASGFYVARGSRRAGKWALALTGLVAIFCLAIAILSGFGEDAAPWLLPLALAAAAWAAVNLLLTILFLSVRTAQAGARGE